MIAWCLVSIAATVLAHSVAIIREPHSFFSVDARRSRTGSFNAHKHLKHTTELARVIARSVATVDRHGLFLSETLPCLSTL